MDVSSLGKLLHGKWFLDLDVFHKGYARACDVQGWHHINVRGRPIYAQRFAAVEPFYNGQARVRDIKIAIDRHQGPCLPEINHNQQHLGPVHISQIYATLEKLQQAGLVASTVNSTGVTFNSRHYWRAPVKDV